MIGIPSAYVDDIWPVAAPLIQKVLDKFDTGYSLDDLKERVRRCEMQLWMYQTKAAFLSEIQVFAQHKTLHVPYIGGEEIGEWFDPCFDVLEAYARANGCRYISGCGRRGWIRQGRSRGYTEEFTIVRKEL